LPAALLLAVHSAPGFSRWSHAFLAPSSCTQLDKVTADAAEFKAGFDKALVDAMEQQAQLDKVAADAAEFKAGYDKLTADTVEQKAQVRGLERRSGEGSMGRPRLGAVEAARAPRLTAAAALLVRTHLQLDKATADAAEFKAGYDKLTVDTVEQQAQLDKATADAAEFKAGFDKALVDAVEQKAEFDERAQVRVGGLGREVARCFRAQPLAAAAAAAGAAPAPARPAAHSRPALRPRPAPAGAQAPPRGRGRGGAAPQGRRRQGRRRHEQDGGRHEHRAGGAAARARGAQQPAGAPRSAAQRRAAPARVGSLCATCRQRGPRTTARSCHPRDLTHSLLPRPCSLTLAPLPPPQDQHDQLLRAQEVLQAELSVALSSYQPKATIDAGTPADKLLAMMTELLDGSLPNLQDILLIQSTILEVRRAGRSARGPRPGPTRWVGACAGERRDSGPAQSPSLLSARPPLWLL
jgi:hypothetical protein